MKLYLAGNFVIMGNIEKESYLQSKIGDDCNRLGSFFYKQQLETLIQLQKRQKGIKETKSKKFKIRKLKNA